MLRTLTIAAALAAPGWRFDTARDPLGHPVYVAFVAPDEARPEVALRFLCGGVTGVVLQFNLGETAYDRSQFSTDEPADEDVRFAFVEGKYDTRARRAPIADGLGTYQITGSEAAFVVGLLADSERVVVSRGEVSFTFPLAGARGAIEAAMSACPYKYPNQ